MAKKEILENLFFWAIIGVSVGGIQLIIHIVAIVCGTLDQWVTFWITIGILTISTLMFIVHEKFTDAQESKKLPS